MSKGAGLSSITEGGLAVALTQDDLDWPGAGGHRALLASGGGGVTGLTAGAQCTVASLSQIPAALLAAQLIEAVSCRAERSPAVASLQPQLAQLLH